MADIPRSGADPRAALESGKRAAKDLAQQAKQRVVSEAEARKEGAAGQVDKLANAVERAAGEFGDNPTLSRYAADFAGSMHGVAGRLRDRNIDELADDVKQLARSNPTAFVLGSVAVGLLLSRFLKATPATAGGEANADGDDASRSGATNEGGTGGTFDADSLDAGTSGAGTSAAGAPDTGASATDAAGTGGTAAGAVSAGGYEPPAGTSANPFSEPALGRTSADAMGRADTLRGTQH